MALLLPLLATLVSGGSALLAAGRWRTNLTLSAAPLAERPSPSPTHCVALCAGWPSPCAAVTLVSGSCRLHEQGVCDDPDTLSLVPLAGARYYDLYNHTWELLKEGGADCETLGLCGWRCYCSVDCPQAGMYPNTTYTCNRTECTLNAGYWQASATLALPLWAEEIATDGQLAIKKTFSVGDRLVFRFEFKVSQIAEITAAITGTAGESLIVTAGVQSNNGIEVYASLPGFTANSLVLLPSILSTSEYRRIALVFQSSGGFDITGEDETISLHHVPFFQATSLASLKFTSPPGVSAFWRMEAGLADRFLLASAGADPLAPMILGREGAFIRIPTATEYEFTFNAMANGKLWVEFRQEYQFQDSKVIRFTIHDFDRTVTKPKRPYVVSVGVSAGGAFTQDAVGPLSALVVVTSSYTPVSLRWSGNSVHIIGYGIDTTLLASVSLPEVNYVGVGCDDLSGAIVRVTGGEPGWSTQGWREEGGRGYSTGNNLP
ncbi:hypothetical protein FJT64_016176 [Amphibalanus amphitrite]|uniref:Uncharacterized protein n=1 Tax=Amphibalanus amphitrite TaxID=1232801 RepID=A0A6A4X0L3_AMPAM|nr:hypothetical protein FJT64_016176 [Amphibalanus amphitrite]